MTDSVFPFRRCQDCGRRGAWVELPDGWFHFLCGYAWGWRVRPVVAELDARAEEAGRGN